MHYTINVSYVFALTVWQAECLRVWEHKKVTAVWVAWVHLQISVLDVKLLHLFWWFVRGCLHKNDFILGRCSLHPNVQSGICYSTAFRCLQYSGLFVSWCKSRIWSNIQGLRINNWTHILSDHYSKYWIKYTLYRTFLSHIRNIVA